MKNKVTKSKLKKPTSSFLYDVHQVILIEMKKKDSDETKNNPFEMIGILKFMADDISRLYAQQIREE